MTECLLCETYDAEDAYLCVGCTKSTVVRLECLPDLYKALAAYLVPGASGPVGRSATAVHAPMPVAEVPLTMRGPGGMVGVVEDWLTLVREERAMAAVVPCGSLEHRLQAAVVGLRNNMGWIAVSWPLAGAFAEEVKEQADAARSIVAPRNPPERGVRLGKCPAVDDSGNLCGAILRLYPGEKVVQCRWCECSFPPATWSGLKVLIDHDEKAADDAA